jgi:hemolysin activation/secretion protein
MNHNQPSFVQQTRAAPSNLHVVQRHSAVVTAFVSLVILASVPAWAQTVPNAGSLQQQIDRGRITTLPGPVAPDKQQLPATQRPMPGATVTVQQFTFTGNTLLNTEQLQRSLNAYLNRPLDFNQLQEAAFAVATAYREAGWIVRTYLPAQDVQQGSVTIQILESIFAGATVNGTPAGRVAPSQVIDILHFRLPIGAPLNARALDRGLLLMNDLPGVAVSGRLTVGQAERETGVALTLGDEPLFTGNAGLDNQGARSTGSSRLTFSGTVNSPAGLADQLQASAIHTEGSDYMRLGYSVPIGVDGWRVGASTSQLQYRLIAPEFVAPVDLQGRGTSNAAGLDASYPLVRSRLRNIYLQANYETKRFDNELSGVTTTRYKSDVLSLGLSANNVDDFSGGGSTVASLTYSNGQLNLDGSPNLASDAVTTQTAGSFSKLRYSLYRHQNLSGPLSLAAALSGQVAGKNLDSSENFTLGGTGGVRAYAASEGAGADANVINLDLQWRIPNGITLSGFYDYGEVQVNHNNNFTGALTLNNYSLKGLGLAVGWQGQSGITLRVTWAQRIGDNPRANAAGNDQDGTLVRDRFWLEANLPF